MEPIDASRRFTKTEFVARKERRQALAEGGLFLMTSLTVLLGLVPMLYATGPGSEIQKPMVAVIFGGMVTSLLLTLLVLPVMYLVFNRDPVPEAAACPAPLPAQA